MKFLALLTLLSLSSCFTESETISQKTEQEVVYYTCSMHPQVREDKPGKCPICHMNLTKVQHNNAHKQDNEEMKNEEVYFCESDPSVTSEAPGICPLDGTPLKKKKTVAQVTLRPEQITHFRANQFEVTRKELVKQIRLLGTVLKSEERQSNIPARVSGRVEEVFVQSTGSFIKKGDPVLKFYSPKLLTGGDEYLLAKKNYSKNKDNREFKDLLSQSKQRLKLWGILDIQLDKWAKENKIPREITIYSPVTGIVESKNAIQGKYFQEGESFFNLVDLNTLWVEMDVYEHDSSLVSLGQQVEIEFNAYPGETWNGVIDFVNPVLDKKTRTLKVRTTLNNSQGKLRPGMAGVASISLKLDGKPIVIPRKSIIDTGNRKVVWILKKNNSYQAMEVRTGFEAGGFVEVKDGLAEGDLVVTDGNFLLDAQTKLFGGSSETHNH